MTEKIEAAVAMLRVIESWGVDHIYGYAGGSINSTMHALDTEQQRIKFIQVRHEQVGALAASADAKVSHKIGVAFGSAGPGAINLLNGLYDAKEDHVPVLALVGQVGHENMNYDFFQEFPEEPMFADVAVYNRTVMTPASLPYVVDKAIRNAYKERGVAVVTIPNDFGYQQIDAGPYDSASVSVSQPVAPAIEQSQVQTVLDLIKEAKYPVFHIGQGIRGASKAMMELADKLQVPIIITGLAKGVIPDDFAGNMGTAYRAASKAADELMAVTDLVVSIGADFSFAQAVYTSHPFKYVQIESDPVKFGRHHHLDYGINGDAKDFINQALALATPVNKSPYYQAAKDDMQNWQAYLTKMQNKQTNPITGEAVYKEINRVATDDAIFSMDVGDNTINSFRYLKMNPKQKLLTSALFATMGCGIPGAIAAKLDAPARQVFNIAGDGAISMVIQDLLTEVKYQLPIFNIVTSNQVLSFIKSEQEDVPQKIFGLDLLDADYAKIAEAMGMKGIQVTSFDQLYDAFEAGLAVTKAGQPVLLDIKIKDFRGLPVEKLDVDPAKTSAAAVEQFKTKYDAAELKPLADYFEKYGVQK
ncbi:pyruvate oxidase [Lactiplantibacillus herbarum]|uniref:pyruvate oxidase n=1 Tax=Lactiplantibacillus herbarum TaxID=1670446 RepID=UPI00064E866C|nr:pyruvate oxidase [Lactiplantibacillus herbarum]